ncbi:MAG: hypothetical protein ACR2G3_11680 [Solirubrobacterales bacterium]
MSARTLTYYGFEEAGPLSDLRATRGARFYLASDDRRALDGLDHG